MSAWLRGRELERVAAAAHVSPDTARAVAEALDRLGYCIAVRRELEAVATAASAALRLQLDNVPGSRDLRPAGECRGCGCDARHVGPCCPDCSCHQLLDAAHR